MAPRLLLRLLIAFAALLALPAGMSRASEEEHPVERHYPAFPPAPASQTAEQAQAKSAGCLSCHTTTDQLSMHASPAVRLGCTDCHGGNAQVMGNARLAFTDPVYVAARDTAHVLPRYPKSWNWPSSANPKHSFALLNKEAPEYVRFVNPGDYRVARESCGACHLSTIEAGERSLMATGAMLWGGAAYNNGVLPYKNYLLGEAYTREGVGATVLSPGDPPGTVSEAQAAKGALAQLYPLPRWQVVPPGDVFRVFERGRAQYQHSVPGDRPAQSQREHPAHGGTGTARPQAEQSRAGDGLRVAIPVLNIHKTRLNDPYLWFMGTNDQPGDYRHSAARPAMSSTPMTANPGIVSAMPPSGATGSRSPPIRPSRQDRSRPSRREGERPSAPACLHPGDPDFAVHELPHAPAQHLPE